MTGLSDDNLLDNDLTPAESPTENKSQDDSEAPDDWKQLDGRSQDRFKRLSQQKRDLLLEKQKLEEELERTKSFNKVPMPPQNGQPKFASDEERDAFTRLTTGLGVPTTDQVQELVREEVENVKSRMYLDGLHDKLETEIAADKNLPAYDRVEIEDYMRKTGIMNPKAAYRDMYHDEVVAQEAQRLVSKNKADAPTSQRTRSRSGSDQPWTRERLAERLRQPDGIDWYKKNKEKILRLQGQLSE